MIPSDIRDLLIAQGHMQRQDSREIILTILNALAIEPASELGELYLEYCPSSFRSKVSFEQLEDILPPSVDGIPLTVDDPWTTPVGAATKFVREVWRVPDDLICLTTTEGEGAYLYRPQTCGVYDFTLGDQTGISEPRWSSFYDFLRWYVQSD